MLRKLDNYDWKQAFGYTGEQFTDEDTGTIYGASNINPVEGATCNLDPFTREEVVEIYAASEGENDGPAWLIAGRLKDGRHFYLEASCDYTGWD